MSSGSNQLYKHELVAAVTAIVDSEMAPLTKWTRIVAELKVANIVYTMDDVSPKLMLVHPDNRSKLGVNAFNAHRTGAHIHKVGADVEQLKKATCFEMCPTEPLRSVQVDFNDRLVRLSDGMLAPVNGSERFLSVSCGHTASFCKAALASCKTPQKTVADSAGRLNSQTLSQNDPAMKAMLEKGWSWTVVPWQCEATWPTLPDIAQRALNASNNAASQASELEVAASIAEFAAVHQQMHGQVDWGKCAAEATSGLPPCIDYVSTIVIYVRLYAGGDGAPMVKYLDDFAKKYSGYKRLGEEFMKAVAETSFGPSRLMPHLRTAFIATNLISPKVVDGVAKLLVKSDVERLKAKDKTDIVNSVESDFAAAWAIAEGLWNSDGATRDRLYPVIGRFHCRAVLLLTGKGKLGFESKEYKSMAEVRDLFIGEVTQAVPNVDIDHEWFKKQARDIAKSSVAPAAPASSRLTTIQDLQDAEWQAREAGVVVGRMYFEKGVGPSSGIYKLVSITAEGCTLEEYTVTKTSTITARVAMDQFLKKWGEYKGQVQVRLTGYEQHLVSTSSSISLHRNKASTFDGLFESFTAHDVSDSLFFCIFPTEVRTREKVTKGELTLVPLTSYDKITVLRGPVEVKIGTDTLHLTEPVKPRTSQPADWRHEVVIVPYWWVGLTTNKDEANMVEKVIKDKGRRLSFPVLVNSKALPAAERLLMYKPKQASVPLESAENVSKKKRIG